LKRILAASVFITIKSDLNLSKLFHGNIHRLNTKHDLVAARWMPKICHKKNGDAVLTSEGTDISAL
jgi:hypothetical protein